MIPFFKRHEPKSIGYHPMPATEIEFACTCGANMRLPVMGVKVTCKKCQAIWLCSLDLWRRDPEVKVSAPGEQVK